MKKLDLSHVKQTKIIATVGPSTDSYDMIYQMMSSGVNGFRLNFSHGDHPQKAQHVKWIRQASLEYGKPVAIIQDLQGPKIRLGEFDHEIKLSAGEVWILTAEPGAKLNLIEKILPIQTNISEDVKPGERLFIFDGKIKTKILEVDSETQSLKIEVINDGLTTQKKGINLPDTTFTNSVITDKDRADIEFGLSLDVDYVALSFVNTEKDIRELRDILKAGGSDAFIIAKIETRAALDNIDKICLESDALMVARGDLAYEIEPEKVPVIQRNLIAACLRYEKVCIVATQMLSSMVSSPEASRADISDIATAVIVGADATMLSDETAMGQYPIEAIETMDKVISYTQKNSRVAASFEPSHDYSIGEVVAQSAIAIAKKVQATAIVVETASGKTAMSVSSWRPKMPIMAVTHLEGTANKLAIVYGVRSFVRPKDEFAATKLTDWLRSEDILAPADIVLILADKYPATPGQTDTIKLRVLE
ncbi:MAG: pyruvate kinase [Candidatus Saccharimonadales bacterium]